MLTRLPLVAILLLSGVGAASATMYLPLAEGTVSHLQGINDATNALEVSVAENTGAHAVLAVVETGGNDFATWLRMSQDLDGTTYLLGQSFDGGATWNDLGEPVVWIDVPLAVGNTWSQSTTLGTDTYEITSEVTAHELVSVPAGDFMAYCIEHVGVVAGALTYTYVEWYAENLGIVKLDWTGFAHGDVYGLTGANIVATEPSTWGKVKALYR
jgi:hypothetical protein